MTTKPKALRLADFLEQNDASIEAQNHVAYELRRLHEVNQMLLETMQTIMNISLMDKGQWAKTIETEAHNAINKAQGEVK